MANKGKILVLNGSKPAPPGLQILIVVVKTSQQLAKETYKKGEVIINTKERPGPGDNNLDSDKTLP